jgi:hypothetical protein
MVLVVILYTDYFLGKDEFDLLENNNYSVGLFHSVTKMGYLIYAFRQHNTTPPLNCIILSFLLFLSRVKAACPFDRDFIKRMLIAHGQHIAMIIILFLIVVVWCELVYIWLFDDATPNLIAEVAAVDNRLSDNVTSNQKAEEPAEPKPIEPKSEEPESEEEKKIIIVAIICAMVATCVFISLRAGAG